ADPDTSLGALGRNLELPVAGRGVVEAAKPSGPAARSRGHRRRRGPVDVKVTGGVGTGCVGLWSAGEMRVGPVGRRQAEDALVVAFQDSWHGAGRDREAVAIELVHRRRAVLDDWPAGMVEVSGRPLTGGVGRTGE